MDTFIRMAEVWVPSEDGLLLESAGGLYEAAPAFGLMSRGLCFGRSEGLPGRAWSERRPLLLSPLAGSYFRRIEAAEAAGVDGALAWPVYAGDRLSCVVLLFCGGAGERVGALELWHNDPRVTGDLTLTAGYFRAADSGLQDITQDAWLPPGAGAPGLAWQKGQAVFIDDLGSDSRFLRAQAAADAGIVRALALPCPVPGGHTWVVSLLSSRRTPIARRTESWLPCTDGVHLQRAFGFCEQQGRLASDEQARWPAEALGAIGQAWRSGVAQAVPGGAATEALPADEARRLGLGSLLALPLMDDTGVSEVIALYL